MAIAFAMALPSSMRAQEPDRLVDRMAYVSDYDPTTIFLFESMMPSYDEKLAADIITYAEKHLGKPYRSGAKGPSAFDCSGFTSYVYGQFGIKLNPSSSSQATQGEAIDLGDAQPGDLIFFSGRGASTSRVGHVGLITDIDDNGIVTFIHASTTGGVRYDTYPDGGYYSRRYISTRRVLDK